MSRPSPQKLSVRDDMEEALQIRAKFACGATRLQEEGFVKILCDEGAFKDLEVIELADK